ncbi:MAG TPA: HTTM domain-containing protein, partial [Aggregatilineales bacterium]|nr:HTTM domain-containing protein [Aggregatilineales bacterium]
MYCLLDSVKIRLVLYRAGVHLRIYSPEDNFLYPRWWFGQIDSRPVSAFRIFFAAWLLKDAIYDLFIAEDFYSDTGFVPLSALRDGLLRTNRFSLMDAMPQVWMAQIFFLMWIAVLIALMIGYRTRLMSILNFLIVLSIHERNIYVLNGADTVIRVLSFWMMFVPMAESYSLDSILRKPVSDEPRTIFAFPVRMMQIQIALVYVFTFILKLPGDIWRDGEALHYALQLQSLTLPFGDWFLDLAPLPLLQLMNYWSLFFEGGFIFFVFLPFFQPHLRLFGLFMGFMMHLGIAVLMSIGNFSFVMMISYFIFIPPEWVERLFNLKFIQRLVLMIREVIPVRDVLPPEAIQSRDDRLGLQRWLARGSKAALSALVGSM